MEVGGTGEERIKKNSRISEETKVRGRARSTYKSDSSSNEQREDQVHSFVRGFVHEVHQPKSQASHEVTDADRNANVSVA